MLSRKIKQTISTILSLCMLLSITTMAVNAQEDTVQTSLSEYVNNEAFVMYKDGTFDVLKYESKDALQKGLETIANDENVKLYQPNYSYEASSLSVDDELAVKQWALYNDGSFYMEEQRNEFPVFDMPFGDAKMPGQWQAPDNFGRPGGNYRRRSYTGRASSVTAQEGIDINIDEAWENYSDSSKEVIVAIVDTGIDYTHEDLSGNIWTNNDEIANNGIDDDGNGYIDDVYGWNFYNNSNKVYTGSEDDHGTHGAGTIIAIADNGKGIAGIVQSDKVKVMSVKALGDQDGGGSTASVIQAIQYAEANGADICNLSLGTSNNDDALYQTISNSNMLFVVAAGNDSQNTDQRASYPASYDLENIITVGNLNYDGTLHYSSNYGENTVDIAAPGAYILSTTTNNGYSYMTGTSMSAPFVSGAAALVYSHYEDISLANVKEILLSSATELDALDGAVTTGGMLDLGNALSFNPENLSGEEWEEKTPYVYKGNAPQIAAQIVNQRNKSYLTVQFYDEDGDIVAARYGKGELAVDDFDNGENGNAVKLTNSGIVTYEATVGTYTFYALDSKGNETVKVVKITESQNRQGNGGRQSGMPGGMPVVQMPGQMPGQNHGMQNPFDMGFGTAPSMNFGFDVIVVDDGSGAKKVFQLKKLQ